MRALLLLAISFFAGCYSPDIADNGYACKIGDELGCPEGFACRLCDIRHNPPWADGCCTRLSVTGGVVPLPGMDGSDDFVPDLGDQDGNLDACASVCAENCVDLHTDPSNCGKCGHVCAAGAPFDSTYSCVAGICNYSCGAGMHVCGKKCVTENGMSCGSACVVCPTVAHGSSRCDSSQCSIMCDHGYVQMGQTCVLAINVRASQVSAGDSHSCAATSSGVACWGNNSVGQFGDGTTMNSAAPLFPGALSGGLKTIAASATTTCGLNSSGTLLCWGDNSKGQFGAGDTTSSLTPRTTLTNLSDFALGAAHACAVSVSGTVRCWGANESGQLGDGTTAARNSPVDVVMLTDVAQVSAGFGHTCAVTQSGAVLCFGLNDRGQLGDGTTENRTAPSAVSGMSSGVSRVACGKRHTCAVTAGGKVKCWGDNTRGQLGDTLETMRTYSSVPIDVYGSPGTMTQVSCGDAHTCGVTTSGSLLCWGDSTSGALGTVWIYDVFYYPSTASGIDGSSARATAVSCGAKHTCAVMTNGGVKCWGDNSQGQIGTGLFGGRQTTPVDVTFIP